MFAPVVELWEGVGMEVYDTRDGSVRLVTCGEMGSGLRIGILAGIEPDRVAILANSRFEYVREIDKLDLSPHRAFVGGVLPRGVYADWLEENAVPVPAEVLVLLRS